MSNNESNAEQPSAVPATVNELALLGQVNELRNHVQQLLQNQTLPPPPPPPPVLQPEPVAMRNHRPTLKIPYPGVFSGPNVNGTSDALSWLTQVYSYLEGNETVDLLIDITNF